jgi:hypothetical protein
MIEDESLGLKIAENETEKFWTEVKENTQKDLERMEKVLTFNKAILEMCEIKLKTALSQ